MLNKQSRIAFSILLIISILLHVLVWLWVDIKELIKPEPSADSTRVQVTLQRPPKPPSSPTAQETPPPPQEKPPQEEKKEEKEDEISLEELVENEVRRRGERGRDA